MAEGRLRRRMSVLWNVDETVDRVNTTLDRFDGMDRAVGGFGLPDQVRKLAGGLRERTEEQEPES